MTNLVIREDGSPALHLAPAVRVVDAKSGNPGRDPRGRFGNLPGRGDDAARKRRRGRQADDGAEGSVERRRDAVVDAARTLTDLSPAGVEAFVRRRWRGDRPLTQADVDAFAEDARRQRVDDLVDVLDARLRTAVYGRVEGARVDFPRGWVRRTLRGLPDDELAVVLRRLREREWSEEQVRRYVVRPFRSVARRQKAERAAS